MNRLLCALLLTACESPLVLFTAPATDDSGEVVHCGTGTLQCGSTCVATQLDDANCGACGNACGAQGSCAAGACYPDDCPAEDCSDSQVCVNEHCTDLTCVGVVCAAGEACALGVCVHVVTACEANPVEDADNCGGCGRACPAYVHAGRRCLTGVCARGVCEPGFFDVDGDATPGCESTCVGLDCTLPDGGVVHVSTPPEPETGAMGNLASCTNVGAPAASATHRHVGTAGEGPGSSGLSSSPLHRNAAGLKSFQR